MPLLLRAIKDPRLYRRPARGARALGVAKAAGLATVNPAAPGMHNVVSAENDPPALVPPQFYHSIETANANGISHVIVPFGNRHGQNNQSELTQSIAVSKDLAR